MTNGLLWCIIGTDNTVNADDTGKGGEMRTTKLSVYESIVKKIERDIALGIIAKDEKLPSCRDLALEMGINPNTVQRAYSTLEERGIIYTIPKKGVYAQGNDSPNIVKEAEEQIRALKSAGITKDQLETIIENIYGGNND